MNSPDVLPPDPHKPSSPANAAGNDRGVPAALIHGNERRALRHVHAAANVAEEHLAGWQRARADYENLRRRIESERAAATDAGGDAVLRGLLPIMDYFAAAIVHMPEEQKQQPWGEGVLRIHQALAGFLRDMGLEEISRTDAPFDPLIHETISEVPDSRPTGTLLEVVQPGYKRNGRILRPAKVKISAGPQGEEPSTEASRADPVVP